MMIWHMIVLLILLVTISCKKQVPKGPLEAGADPSGQNKTSGLNTGSTGNEKFSGFLDVEVGEFNETRTRQMKKSITLHIADTPSPGMFIGAYDAIDDALKDRIYNTQSVLAELNDEKQLYAIESDLLPGERCYPYLIDIEKKYFIVSMLLDDLIVPINSLNVDLTIYSAGKICLDKNSRIISFDNDSRYSSSFHSNENMLGLLKAYSITIRENSGMNLSGGSFFANIAEFISSFRKSDDWTPVKNVNPKSVETTYKDVDGVIQSRRIDATLYNKTSLLKKSGDILSDSGKKIYSGTFSSIRRRPDKVWVGEHSLNQVLVGSELTSKSIGFFKKKAAIKSDVLKQMDFHMKKVSTSDELLSLKTVQTMTSPDGKFTIRYIPNDQIDTAGKNLGIDYGKSAVLYPQMGSYVPLNARSGADFVDTGPYIIISKN